jgi:hypothetical protein
MFPIQYVKRKILLMCLINHYATNPCRGLEVQFHAFLTSTLGGVSGQLRHQTALTPLAIEHEAGWAPESVWKFWRRE